ncbi:MAG TPA: VWA domain-containing protein, partial [Thermoanaerobaculia bacterium]|nr:VWA domain-containing protein [Thermoanaerobaculia bacterium]
IPVQVIADGKPVRGLTVADFAVYEGRRQRAVVGFDTVDLQTLPAGAEVPGAARRWFLMLFDLSFSNPDSVDRARFAAIDMVDLLHSSDLVAVATYRRSGVDLVLGFTSDREQIRAALLSLGLPDMIERSSDPLKIIVVEHSNEIDEIESGGDGPKGPEHLRREPRPQPRPTGFPSTVRTRMSGLLNPMFHAEKEAEAATREGQKAAIDAMADSFVEIARLMRAISGRKEVLLFSEGFDSAVLKGTEDKDERDRMVVEGSEVGAIWRVDSEERFGSGATLAEMERMLEELRRADCRVHTIDISGLRATGSLADNRANTRDSLFQIARDTGGDLYENFNDLSAAVGKMLERSGVTYVLTIQPEDLASDGSYHPLRVELKRGSTARGARVVHRPGYYAPRHFAERGKLDRTLTISSRLLSGDEPGLIPTSVLATPFPKNGTTAFVPVLVQVDGPALMEGNGDGELLAEIYVYAMDEAGSVRDYLAQALALELTKVEAELREGGLRFLGHLELPPGNYSLRVLAMNGRTGAFGLRTAKVEIPEMGAGQPVLLPPLFPQPPGRGVVTREAASEGQEVPFPFTQDTISYLPNPEPVLEEGKEAPVALVGYHLAGDLKIRTQIVTPDGREVAAGGLRVLGRETSGADGAERLRAAFLPPKLAPGEYLLRVTVTGAGAEKTSTAPFVVAASPAGP